MKRATKKATDMKFGEVTTVSLKEIDSALKGLTKKNPCTKCGEPGLTGLAKGQGLCKWHWAEGLWGKEWAIKCHGPEPKRAQGDA